MRLASRPPYSSGHDTTAHRLSKSLRAQSRCRAKPARVSPDGRSWGTLASSHCRASARNASSASVNLRSTPTNLSKSEIHRRKPTRLERTHKLGEVFSWLALLLDDHRGAVAEEALVGRQADAGAFDLAAVGLAAHLPDQLAHLGQ